jgi:hypothetical protein
MMIGGYRLAVPSNAEYSVPQVRMLLREIEIIVGRPIDLSEWSGLR